MRNTPANHLYIVTDNAREASLAFFGVLPARLPGFVTVVDGMETLFQIPFGAATLSFWTRDGSAIEATWRELRALHKFDNDYAKHCRRIEDWLVRRLLLEAAYCAEAVAQEGEQSPTPAPNPEPAVIPFRRQSKWS